MHNFILEWLSSLGVNLSNDALIVIIGLIAALVGFSLGKLLSKRKIEHKERQFREQQSKDQALFDDQLDQLNHSFSTLSQEALRHNNESFLNLAKQSFSQLQSSAHHDLLAREQGFANLIKPIQQSIKETDQQLKRFELDRKATEAKLSEQIGGLLNSQHALQSETRNLVTALRRPEVRGQWGELTLKRLVELAGMAEHCDFDLQTTVNTENGQLRPDMLIHLPNQRQLVVDVKTPLDAYLSANEASDETSRSKHLLRHARNLKTRIQELAKKQYWEQFSNSPDFVILFIPGDQFLSSALDQDKSLLEFALERRILLATPTSLVGLLRAIAYGWNQETLSKNSEQIKQLGETLYNRLLVLTEHLNALGKNLDQSVSQYNKVIGSFESKALPAAKKLSSLGLDQDQQIELTGSLSTSTRRTGSELKPD